MLETRRWRRITWRTGTTGPLNARFAAVRVRVADGPCNAENTRLPGEELWLIGEWRDSGEKKYYLSNLPKRTTLRRLVATIKARWSCEQVHQQLKQELGLGDFEGRSWTGLHRHALMTCIAFAYLQHRRLKAAGRGKNLGRQNVLVTDRAFRRSRPGGADGQNINPRVAGSGRGTVAGADGVPGLRPSDAPALR
jgi:SRSO17 transposase